MNELNQRDLKACLVRWFSRRTTNSAVRRVSELPLAIGSDIGIQRKENQDRVAVLRMGVGPGHFFTVAALCDGMGGMAEGAASASQALAVFFAACVQSRDLPLSARLTSAAQEANRAVHSIYRGRGGATLSAILCDSTSGTVGVNIGDSRIYSYYDNKLEQLTVDDTMLGLLPNLKDASQHGNGLLQYVGMGDCLEPHIIQIPEDFESLFVTCDGVHFINNETLEMVIQSAKDSAVAVKRLIEISKWCGGHDNASVVAFQPFNAQLSPHDQPGTVQVWDPFGELDIIAADSIKVDPIENSKLLKDPGLQKTPDGIRHPTHLLKRKKATKKEISVKVIPKTDGAGATSEPLRVKIYFKDDSDKDGHNG